jgi:hypothetical protein
MKYLKTYDSKYNESDVDDILNQIAVFLKSNNNRIWIGNDAISIYVRKSKRSFNGQMYDFFDFASIDATETGTGLFTQILKIFEEIYPDKNIYIESVLTDRFANYIKNILGFEPDDINSNNFYKVKNNN